MAQKKGLLKKLQPNNSGEAASATPWVKPHLGVEPKIGGKPPKWMVKIMENPIF